MTLWGPTAVGREVQDLLVDLDDGVAPGDVERRHVDVKEEAGRRDGATVVPGPASVDEVAQQLLAELACMANTPGGGAIVLGVADDGARTGATVDPEELRHRIWEISQRRLTVAPTPHQLRDGTDVLILTVHAAVEPIRVNGRILWRIADNCVDVDPATWFATQGRPAVIDWSAEASETTIDEADAASITTLRRFLDDANRSEVHEGRTDAALLRAIAGLVADDEGTLTNAGRLLVTDQEPAMVYVHRKTTGGEGPLRVRQRGSLLVQLAAVLDAVRPRLSTVSLAIPGSPVVAQHQTLPSRAVREAVVNAIVHRDWTAQRMVIIEHVGDRLTVTSPGGFFGTVNADNILTHPSLARYPALARAADAAGIAEQQGVGVDRMYLDLLVIGRPAPSIEELDGPRVRTRLFGGRPDENWFQAHRQIEPRTTGADLRILIAIDLLSRDRFLSAQTLAPAIQDDEAEAENALELLEEATLLGRPGIERVEGRPRESSVTWKPSDQLVTMLPNRFPDLNRQARREMLVEYARQTGRVSTSEVKSLVGVSQGTANADLKALEREGYLRGATEAGGGRSFHYLPGDA